MEIQKIISNVFDKMYASYETIFGSYYPSHGSNGFTERNLTFYFSHNYLMENKNAIIWQEVPVKYKKHFDTLIIDNEHKIILIIEAKRLQSDDKFADIEQDYQKIKDLSPEIKDINEKYATYKKYAMLLVDIWIPPTKSKNKSDLKNRFEELSITLDKQSRKIIAMQEQEYSDEEYWIMYNLYSINEM